MKKERVNKVVVITGSSSGIGLATSKFLISKGYIVYGIARNLDKEGITKYVCDVTDEDKMNQIFNKIFEKEGRIDYLINNAGIGISGAIEHTSNADIDKIFNINIIAPIKLSRNVIPFMRKNNFGRIINISSIASVIPLPFQACYSATKASIQNFSSALNNEVKDFNIRVTGILPGDTKTGFTDARIKNKILEDENYKKRINTSISKMEKDERKGKDPITVSKVIYKVMKRKNPPISVAVGFEYKLVVFLARILPQKWLNNIIKKIYG